MATGIAASLSPSCISSQDAKISPSRVGMLSLSLTRPIVLKKGISVSGCGLLCQKRPCLVLREPQSRIVIIIHRKLLGAFLGKMKAGTNGWNDTCSRVVAIPSQMPSETEPQYPSTLNHE